jgi:hypothetical protein
VVDFDVGGKVEHSRVVLRATNPLGRDRPALFPFLLFFFPFLCQSGQHIPNQPLLSQSEVVAATAVTGPSFDSVQKPLAVAIAQEDGRADVFLCEFNAASAGGGAGQR